MEFSYGEADSHSANQEIRPLNNTFFMRNCLQILIH